jgi:GNAT superfamily N-acetyltransferase
MSETFMQRTGGLTVRTAGKADAERLIGLFNEAFRKAKDARTAHWKYFDSPHGVSTTLLAEGPRGEPAGAYSYVYRRFTYRGAPVEIAQASDAMVSPSFRKRGIFTGLDDECAETAGRRGVPACFATAGRQSHHGFLKNGWREIGPYRTWIALFDTRRSLARRFGGASALLAPFVAVGLAVGGKRPRLELGGHAVLPTPRFDDRFTALFEATKARLPLVGVRDAAWLNWRYVDTPTRKHRAFAILRGDALVGYVVTEDGEKNGYVVDLLGQDEAAEDAALRAGLADLRARGLPLAYVQAPRCPPLERLFARNGLFPHPKRQPFRFVTPFIVRTFPTPPHVRVPGQKVLLDPASWYILDGDRDVEHMSQDVPRGETG